MFDAQYIDPSGFSIQPQFIPSSHLKTQSSSSDAIYFNTDMFQRFVPPPATASSIPFLQPAFQTSENMTNVNYVMDFPVAVQAEGQYSGNNLIGGQFGSLDGIDTLDKFNLSNNLERNVSSQLEWFDDYVPSYTNG